MTSKIMSVTLIGFFVAAIAAAEQPTGAPVSGICNQLFGPPQGVRGASGTTLPVRTRAVFDLCFDGDQWHTQPPPNTRLTNKDAVWIRVRHFNFLRYALAFDVKEEKAESYGYLTKLWSSILNPDLGVLIGALSDTAGPGAGLLNATRAVYHDAQEVQRRIDAAIAPHKKPGLTPDEVRTLTTTTSEVSAAAAALSASYRELQRLVESDPDTFKAAFASTTSRYYNLASTSYATASSRADSFLALAARSLGDDVKKIGTRDEGTRVTVTLTATDQSGASDDFETIHYFVQTSMPLVAHAGVAFSGVKDISFKQVKRAVQFSEEDFFQQQGTGDASGGFSAFLAWQFFTKTSSLDASAKQQPLAVMLSIGTDIQSPGEEVFIGPSVMLFGRFVITAGASIGREAEGQQAIEPNVFRLVRHHGTTTWFSSFSIRVY
jgi:hypothetical protein